MQQGPTELKILEQAGRAGSPLPESIQNAPELRLGLGIFFSGFLDLSNCRSSGMVEGPIPWTAIQAYCDWMGLDDETAADMHFHISNLDAARSKYHRSKEDKKKIA
jgi:hypothetical protein